MTSDGAPGVKVLLLGFSSIARRRVLPALAAIGVTHVDVASRRGDVALPSGLSGQVFDDYREAILHSDADLVYVSTVNSTHAEFAAMALQEGRHVVVDKPLAMSLDEVRTLVGLAREKQRIIAEASVWEYHPQVALARAILGESPATVLVALFSFPRLPAGNFRHRASHGGGALWDLGPYAVTAGRVFFDAVPYDITCRDTIVEPDDEVEGAFGVVASYPGARSMVGQFGTATTYVNRLDVVAADARVVLEPAFTSSPELTGTLQVHRQAKRRAIEAGAADTFALFLSDVLAAIETRRWSRFAQAILADAEALHRLRLSAASGEGPRRGPSTGHARARD